MHGFIKVGQERCGGLSLFGATGSNATSYFVFKWCVRVMRFRLNPLKTMSYKVGKGIALRSLDSKFNFLIQLTG